MQNHSLTKISDGLSRSQLLIMLIMASIALLMQLATGGNYGIFRDEFYYLDCARHLDWGYVDHPPLSIALLKLLVAVLGDSLFAIRIIPAVLGSMFIFLTGLLASKMGSDDWGVFLACLAALIAPVYIISAGYYSMNIIEMVFWAGLYLIITQYAISNNQKLWVWFGIVLGLALQNKYGVAALAAGLIPALLITGNGKVFKSKYGWAGSALAGLIFLPHLIWQIAHEWPTSEFIRNASAEKIEALSFPHFFSQQIMLINPILFPVWIFGLIALLFWKPLKQFRMLGIIWIGALLFFGFQQSKPYYLSPAYPPLLAAGAVSISSFFKSRFRWIRPAAAALFIIGGLFIAPLSLPILEPPSLAKYMERMGMKPKSGEMMDQAELPQYFADRFGWENMTRTVAIAYKSLPDSIRSKCIIITKNYGEAGALNYYGKEYGIKKAYSQHNSHYLWGTDNHSGEIILTVNYSIEELRDTYTDIRQLATIVSEWAMPYETDVPVYLCQGLKKPWPEAWRQGKLYI